MKDDLRERTKRFALRIIRTFSNLPKAAEAHLRHDRETLEKIHNLISTS